MTPAEPDCEHITSLMTDAKAPPGAGIVVVSARKRMGRRPEGDGMSETARLGSGNARLEKAVEVGHRDSLVQPNVFVLQRRMKEIELRTQRIEEMLSAVFLTLEQIRQAVGVDRAPEGPGFRLPAARPQPRRVPMGAWWREPVRGLTPPGWAPPRSAARASRR
jgi:hypothetical protein